MSKNEFGTRKGWWRALLASAGSLALLGGASVAAAVPTTAAKETTPTVAVGSCLGANPMGAATPAGSESGYTPFVTGDAVLANSEMEGTLAVGGTTTFGDPRGNQNLQYPIQHGGIGGNADYAVPTIDGAPNRALIQRFASYGKIAQVKDNGATGDNAKAGAKIADQSTPDNYTFGQMFGGSGTTYFPVDGGNMSPQIDSAVQTWTGLEAAKASWGIKKGAVLDYFPEDAGSSLLESVAWAQLAAPTASDQTLVLNGKQPSKLPLSAFKDQSGSTHAKFQLAGYNTDSFLVIEVDNSDIVNGRVVLPSYSHAGKDSNQKEGISYVLFDFSSIAGDVEVVAPNEPVRGSIYAPNAHIIFPTESEGGKEFEGQLIAKELTALQGGKEMHTNLFKGRVSSASCDIPETSEGTFALQKILLGVEADKFPEGTTFPVTASWDGGEKTFNLPADGTVLSSELNLPYGTVVTLTEGDLPAAPEGYSFVSNQMTHEKLTIGEDGANTAWALTNTYGETAAPEPARPESDEDEPQSGEDPQSDENTQSGETGEPGVSEGERLAVTGASGVAAVAAITSFLVLAGGAALIVRRKLAK